MGVLIKPDEPTKLRKPVVSIAESARGPFARGSEPWSAVLRLESNKMMTYKELAAWWNVPLGTIYAWVARGCIPHVRLADRSVRFERTTLEKWLATRRMPASSTGRKGAKRGKQP